MRSAISPQLRTSDLKTSDGGAGLCPGLDSRGGRLYVDLAAKKRKPGWFARFLLASSWMRLHHSAARLALSLPLAGLGPVRSPGKCFLMPILKPCEERGNRQLENCKPAANRILQASTTVSRISN